MKTFLSVLLNTTMASTTVIMYLVFNKNIQAGIITWVILGIISAISYFLGVKDKEGKIND